MSTELATTQSAEAIIVTAKPSIETAMRVACQKLADETFLPRFEIAVKSRVANGIKDDNDLRQTDELLVNVCRGADTFEAFCGPPINAAHKLHKALTTEAKTWCHWNDKAKRWEGRWGVMRDQLTRIVLKYKKDKADLAARQQAELDRAAQEERDRFAAEARMALRNGDVATAELAMQESRTVVAPIIAQATPVLDHSIDRKPWEVTITDPMALVKAIAAGIVPITAIKEWNTTFLKKEATTRGGLPVTWAGVAAKQVDALAVRR